MDKCTIKIAHEGKVFDAKIFEKWVGHQNQVILAKAQDPENYWMVQNFFTETGRKFDTIVSLQSAKNIENHREILKGLHYEKEDKCKIDAVNPY